MEMKLEIEAIPGEKTSAILEMSEETFQSAVLLCHGFMSNKESQTNRELSQALLLKNISTLRYDLFGHGASEGPFEELTLTRCLLQAEGVLQWMKEAGFTKLGLVGSSFGGLIALHTASRHPEFLVLGLKCPVSDYPAIWENRLGDNGMKNWRESGMLSLLTPEGRGRLGFFFYEDLLRYNSREAAAALGMPTCIVHGDADEDVPISQSHRLLEQIQSSTKELVVVPGANHNFSEVTDFGKMTRQIGGWLIQYLR